MKLLSRLGKVNLLKIYNTKGIQRNKDEASFQTWQGQPPSLRRPLGLQKQVQQDQKYFKIDIAMAIATDMGIADVFFHQHFV